MKLSNLAHDAHRIAVDKGFWQTATSRSVIATKVALIHTEIAELHEVATLLAVKRQRDAIAEEAADIVIRTLDLAAALDLPLAAYEGMTPPLDTTKEDASGWGSSVAEVERRIAHLHSLAAGITQADRKDDAEARTQAISALVFATFRFAAIMQVDDFLGRIRIKMEHNRSRPQLHGRGY